MAKDIEKKTSGGALANYGEFEGVGFENQDANDIQIGFVGIVQDLSPELKSSKPEYIEGISLGQMFNSATRQILPAEFTFVPCSTRRAFVEWVPRNKGGGFVGMHEPTSDVVRAAQANSTKINDLVTPEGNTLTETFYVTGVILDSDGDFGPADIVVLSMTSTKIKVYKSIMTRLRSFKGGAPLFAHRLKVSTVEQSNNSGDFFNFRISPAIDNDVAASLLPADSPLLPRLFEVAKASNAGTYKVDHESTGVSEGDDDIPL